MGFEADDSLETGSIVSLGSTTTIGGRGRSKWSPEHSGSDQKQAWSAHPAPDSALRLSGSWAMSSDADFTSVTAVPAQSQFAEFERKEDRRSKKLLPSLHYSQSGVSEETARGFNSDTQSSSARSQASQYPSSNSSGPAQAARSFNESSVLSLRALHLFQRMDLNSDGEITKAELIEVMERSGMPTGAAEMTTAGLLGRINGADVKKQLLNKDEFVKFFNAEEVYSNTSCFTETGK